MQDRIQYIKKLRAFWIQNEVPNITEQNALFLRNLIKLQQTQNMLEIWSANGFSAIQFGLELEQTKWKLTTIEFSWPSHKQVLENISIMNLENTIKTIAWNALFVIPELDEIYDFVFIDAMKRRTINFFDLIYDKVKIWWIIVIDDVIKFRDKMWDFWAYLEKNDLVYSLLPIDGDDWILFMIKTKRNLDFRVEKDY